MTGLIFFCSEDFNIKAGNKGNLLCNNIPGISLCLFYSTQCSYCQQLIPEYKKLPGSISGCHFGMINVSKQKSILHVSKNCLTPIQYVPLIILYANGTPLARYDGPNEIEEIKKFVIDISQKLHNDFNEENGENGSGSEGLDSGIPEYSIGRPIEGKMKVCYLDFDEAYIEE